MKRKHLYVASFNCEIRCLHKKDKDKFLAKASLNNIQDHLPKDIDFEKNEDLIAFAANGTVINRGNKNGHLMDAATAIKVHELFKYKFLDLEHNRDNIVGVITNTGFSSYEDNKTMDMDEASSSEDPFYLTVGGVVYRSVNQAFAEKLEESSDPESKLYRKISLSWEVAFSSYYLLIGSKNLSEGKIVKDEKELKEYSKFLDFNGGNNKLEDGTPIYTVVAGDDVLPMGFGFTLSPASEVEGVLLESETSKKDKEKEAEAIANKNNTSLLKEKTVKIHKTPYIHMDIKSLDEFYKNWNQLRAHENAPDLDFVFNKLQEASEQYSKTVKAKEDELSETKEEVAKLSSDLASLKTSLEESQSSLKVLKDERIAQEEKTKFQERMNVIDEEYELNDETSAIVASKIKGLSDEDFETWKKEFDVLANEKSKAYLSEKKKVEEATASKIKADKVKEDEVIAKEALAKAKEKKGEETLNGTSASESVRDAWAAALKDGFVITK